MLAAALAISLAGPLRGQDVAPLGKADDAVQAKLLREFEDLARAKIISGRLETFDKRKNEIVVKVDGAAEPSRLKLDRNTEVWAKIDIRGPDGKPATKQRPSLLSRLKEGQTVTVYLDEAKGKVIRVLVDKTGEK
jgi:hypothetical protein